MNENGLKEKLEELKRLDRGRFDYVIARSEGLSVEGALKRIGRSKGWFYGLGEEERKRLDDMANELHYEIAISAMMLLSENVLEAVRVKVKGLRSGNERIRQQVATEIIDRVLGKAGENVNVSGNVGVTLIWNPHKE